MPALSRRALVGAALAGCVGAAATGCSDDFVAPAPVAASDAADPAAAAVTLDALRAALRSGDGGVAGGLGADASATALLEAVAANVAAIGLVDLDLRYITETGRTRGADGWDGVVEVTWRVDGIDTGPARAEVPFSFARGGRALAGIGAPAGAGGVSRLPLWLAGPVTVRRVPDGLVVAAVGAAPRSEQQLATFARQARVAVRQVRSVVGGRTGLVIEVPADGAGLVRALAVEPGTYDAIAAVTAPVDGSQDAGTPVHVFLNPDVFDRLDPQAAQVVMTHEATHALTGAPLSVSAPLWLVEGFADYVALRDVDLPPSRTAGQIIAQVRGGGAPDELPTNAQFGTTDTHLGAVYEAAWQVMLTLAARRDEATLVSFYDRVLAGARTAPTLQEDFGWSEAQLTAAWRERLTALAGVQG